MTWGILNNCSFSSMRILTRFCRSPACENDLGTQRATPHSPPNVNVNASVILALVFKVAPAASFSVRFATGSDVELLEVSE